MEPDNLQEKIRVSKKGTQTTISGKVIGFDYIDNDTGSVVIYIPSLDISGYGENHVEATEMIEFCLENYLKELVKNSIKEIHKELSSLGWRSQKYKSKDFSPMHNPMSKLNELGITDYRQKDFSIAA